MKTILKIILMLTALITISCGNMYNDLAVEIGEYNYYLAVSQQSAAGKTYIYSLNESGSQANQSWALSPGVAQYNIAADPAGNFLYIIYKAAEYVEAYKFNKDASLTYLQQITSTIANPHALKIHPSGKYAYVSNIDTDDILMFSINPNGTWSALSPASILSSTIGGLDPSRIAIDYSGSYLFVANTGVGPDLTVFNIGSNGILSGKSSCNSLGIAGIKDVILDKNNHVYISSTGGIYSYNISNNSLTLQDSNGNAAYLATHPSGKYLYCLNTAFKSYKINSDGSLTLISSEGTAPASLRNIVIHPNGNFMYITDNNAATGYFGVYQIKSDGSIQTSAIQTISLNSAVGLALIRKRKE